MNWLIMDVYWMIMSNELVVSFGSAFRSHQQGSRYYPSLILEFNFEVPHIASDMGV